MKEESIIGKQTRAVIKQEERTERETRLLINKVGEKR